MRFTDDQVRDASEQCIAEILISKGEIVKGTGNQKKWMHDGHPVSINGNLWFDHYDQVGGNSIQFLMNFYDCTFLEAVDYLLKNDYKNLDVYCVKQKKHLVLPKRNTDNNRIETYLNVRRKIDLDVIYNFESNGLIYEEDYTHNVVFVGLDTNRKIRHIFKRGIGKLSTYKKMAIGSQSEYSFHWTGSDNEVYFFEGAIDLLSFICMNKENWQKHNYVAACGVSQRSLNWFVANHENVNKVYLCFDNDRAGQEATERIVTDLRERNIDTEILIPEYKDWNEDLICLREDEMLCRQGLSLSP